MCNCFRKSLKEEAGRKVLLIERLSMAELVRRAARIYKLSRNNVDGVYRRDRGKVPSYLESRDPTVDCIRGTRLEQRMLSNRRDRVAGRAEFSPPANRGGDAHDPTLSRIRAFGSTGRFSPVFLMQLSCGSRYLGSPMAAARTCSA